VCIVLLSGIGDVVHGLPLAIDIKRARPDAEVVWVAEPAPAAVLENHPAVDRIIVFRSRDGLRGVRSLARAMRGMHADLALNIQRYFKGVWPSMLSGAATRVGLSPSKTRDGVAFFQTHALAEGPWKHTQELFLDFRWALGVDRDAPVRWDVRLTSEELRESDALFSRLQGGRVASLVVASANPRKDWPARRYARLAESLSSDFGFRVMLLGGPSDRERAIADMVLEHTSGGVTDGLSSSVRQLMARVARSSLVVAPDTGPLHLAHALEVPVVGLFGHTNPWRVGPWRHFRDLVVDRYTEPGSEPDPSGYLPKEGRMELIRVEDVLEKVEVAEARYLRSPGS
jgi:heptosyltransferase I